MKDIKVIGGILMILGTSIGAGMLALPITLAHEGFMTSLVLLVGIWLVMTWGAFLILEVTLWLPEKTNLISMSGHTLGKIGQTVSWVSYLLLLYALLCAYISGNSDILQGLLALLHFNVPIWVATIIVVLVFGSIVYRGIYSVDIVNRLLMSSKILLYLLLVLIVVPHIDTNQYSTLLSNAISIDTIMVMLTSFGFAIIVPSLRDYFKSDVRKLRLVILVGSVIPLLFYIVWISIIQGVLTLEELNFLAHAKNTITVLTGLLQTKLHNGWLITCIRSFTSICAATSFLGVSLCLCDFLADGVKINKTSKKGILVYVSAFVPPLLIVSFAPNIFVTALSYAGIFCIILLVLMPALMVYSGRYLRKVKSPYKASGGKILLGVQIAISLGLLAWEISKYFTR